MIRLIYIEFLKLKRSLLLVLLPAITLLPIILIVIKHFSSDKKATFFSTVASSNVILPVSIFAIFVILTSFIFGREYKGNINTYTFITPNSRTKMLLSKIIVNFIVITVLDMLAFTILLLISFFCGELTTSIVGKMLAAGLLSSIMYFLLSPVVIFIVLIKEDFVSSLLISLVFFMFTCPFIYKGNIYYYLPHLVPIVTVADFLGVNENTTPNYIAVFAILIAVFCVFLSLSIWKYNKKE